MSQLRSISQSSRSAISNVMQVADDISDSDLIRQVNDLKEQIHVLRLENEILERAILRLDPALMNGVQAALDYANKIRNSPSLLNVGSALLRSQTSRLGFESLASPSRLIASPSRISTRRVESSGRISGTLNFSGGKRINVLERSELVSTEIEIVINLLEKARREAAKNHSLYRAKLEEIQDRVEDAERASDMFNQTVIIEGIDKITHRIPAENWIAFMTEWMKIINTHIGKLRLRTSTLNTQFHKLKSQIKLKEELSESLRPVDFEKLKIQNGECLEIIDTKLEHLVELKKMTGDANLNLTIHKNLMTEQNNYLTNVFNTINKKKQDAILIDKERDIIKDEVGKLEVNLDNVKKLRQTYKVPDIMEYVQVKAEVNDLKNCIKTLQNRYRIQQIALTSLNKKLQSLCIDIDE